jgi:ubiquitin carboxyl-terminal hydrolase 14
MSLFFLTFVCVLTNHQLALPVGLKNLGNTCYMNATIQAMRSIPELQTSLADVYVIFIYFASLMLKSSVRSSSSGIRASLNNLYSTMSRTTDVYVPLQFLAALRQAFPQFAELSRAGGNKGMQAFAQQGKQSPSQL